MTHVHNNVCHIDLTLYDVLLGNVTLISLIPTGILVLHRWHADKSGIIKSGSYLLNAQDVCNARTISFGVQ